MRLRHPRHRLAGLLLAGVVALTAGCSNDGGTDRGEPGPLASPPAPAQMSPVPADADHNAADVVFAQETRRHLEQATRMAQLAGAQAGDAEVKKLAVKAAADRSDPMFLLERWLDQNKQPVPTAAPTAGQAKGVNGLATAEELAALGRLRGEPFDRLFLQMLIINNESATNLLNAQQWSGKNPALMAIAHKLAETHKTELVTARRLLGG